MLPLELQIVYDNTINYINTLRQYKTKIKNSSTLEEQLDIMKEVYSFAKLIAPMFFEDFKHLKSDYNLIVEEIMNCEFALPNYYIIENNPQLTSPLNILEYIVYITRDMLVKKVNKNAKNPSCLADIDLSNKCAVASRFITKFCHKYHIPNKRVLIETGYIKTSRLSNGMGYHYFNIVTLNNHDYLIDCTYSQFFLIRKNILECLGIPGHHNPYAGLFMVMDSCRKKVAEEILEKGYIKITPDVLKHYLDGFTLSYRNGLYYECTNDFSYTTNYQDTNYQSFLKREDNQLNYENKLHLGLQRYPLNNPNLNFQKR